MTQNILWIKKATKFVKYKYSEIGLCYYFNSDSYTGNSNIFASKDTASKN